MAFTAPPPPPPARRKSFQIKVTVSIFKLVKVPAILNTKFRFDGSMVGGGGGGGGAGGGTRSPKPEASNSLARPRSGRFTDQFIFRHILGITGMP